MSSSQNCVDSAGPSCKRVRLEVEEFDVGTLVWARLLDAVWWPAMIEKTSSTLYSVLYFDEGGCLQGWVNPRELLPFTGLEDSIGDEARDGQPSCPLRAQLQAAVGIARMSLMRSREERAQSLLERCRLADNMDHVDAWSGVRGPLVDGDPGGREARVHPSPVNAPGSPASQHGEQSLGNALGDGDLADLLSESDTEPAYASSSSSEDGDSAYGADSSDSFDGVEWAVGRRLAALSEEAVVPGSQEAVYPGEDDDRYDAVVPWPLDGEGGQGGQSSEAVVPDEEDDVLSSSED